MSTIITSGDDLKIPITLKVNGIVYSVDLASTVRAAFISTTKCSIAAGPFTLVSTAAGADWANGLVVFEVTSEESSVLSNHTKGELQIEIEVDSPADGKKTWRVEGVSVVKGMI